MSLGEMKTAAALRDFVRAVVQREIDRLRPRGRDATIVGLDYDARKAIVQYADEPESDPIPLDLPTGLKPTSVGQLVRVEGQPGRRYIAAILEGTAELAPETIGTGVVPNDDLPPATPLGLAATPGVGSAVITWDANTEADMVDGFGTYEVQIALDNTFGTPITTEVVGATAYTATGIPTGTTLYARVRAIDAHGNVSAWSVGIPIVFNVKVITEDIAAAAITNIAIADDAVTAPKIAAGEIGTNHLAALSVLAGKIGAGAIETDKLAANAVTAAKIDVNAVHAAAIQAGAVDATKIAANQVLIGHTLKSTNYNGTDGTDGTIGWGMFANGALDAQNARIRGIISATSLQTIPSTNRDGWIEVGTATSDFVEFVMHPSAWAVASGNPAWARNGYMRRADYGLSLFIGDTGGSDQSGQLWLNTRETLAAYQADLRAPAAGGVNPSRAIFGTKSGAFVETSENNMKFSTGASGGPIGGATIEIERFEDIGYTPNTSAPSKRLSLLRPPMLVVRRTTNQSPNNSGWQALTHNVIDRQVQFTIVGTNQYRPDLAGWYWIVFDVSWSAGSYWAGAGISRNGSTTIGGADFVNVGQDHTNAVFGPAQSVKSPLWYFNGTSDYFQVMVWPTATGRTAQMVSMSAKHESLN